jgi:single-stranded DNA-specific DHH superfamily exonuclease
MAAIGTLADVVPLTGKTAIIAKLGLGMLSADRTRSAFGRCSTSAA